MYKIILMMLLVIVSANSVAESTPDMRTPFEKYQGAYTGAWLLCTMKNKLAYVRETGRKKNIEMDSDRDKDLKDIEDCIKDGLGSMKIEYKNMLSVIVRTNGAGKALTDHYVNAILTVKGISYRSESEADFMQRLNENRKKTEELWTRFEITQP